jgi:putative peptidoglycan lipid II flippase
MYNRVAGKIRRLSESVNGRIFTAAIIIAALASLVKVVSLAKEMLIARIFGAGDALDAFYVALLLPCFLASIMVNSFGCAFVPTYIQVRETKGDLAAQRLFSSVAAFNLAALLGLSLFLAVTAQWLLPIIGSSFGPEKLALTRTLFFVSLGLLSVTGLSMLWRAMLNARECFALTALAPIMTPVIILIAMVASSGSLRIYALALGTVFGAVGELAIAGYGLKRRGIPIIPRWYGLTGPVRQVLGQAAPAAAGAVLMGSTTLVDQSMAAMLGSGSVAALNYANKLTPLLLSIGVSSLATAVLPSFSRLSANQDWAGLRHILNTYTNLIALVTVPLAVVLIIFSEPLIATFFQAGAFTAQDAHLVARVQSLLFLQLPFYAVGNLYVSAISSLRRNQILMWGTIIAISVNILLNLLFMRILGLPGIALSTSGVYLINVFYLRIMLMRTLRESEGAEAKAACAMASVASAG